MANVDDREVIVVIDRLRSLGLVERNAPLPESAPRRGGSPIFRALRTAGVGFAFELEGAADKVPAGNFWVSDPKFLTELLRRMHALAPDHFRPTDVVDEPVGEGHLLSFTMNAQVYSLPLDADWLWDHDCHACLTRVFELVERALADAGAPCTFLCIEGERIEHWNCEYCVVAVDASMVDDIRATVPVCFGPRSGRATDGRFVAARIRRPVEVVGADRMYVEDGEIVDQPDDYVTVVENVARTAASDLALREIRCTRSASDRAWQLSWTNDDVERSVTVPANGWVAVGPLVSTLNDSLPRTTEHRFFEFREPEWGQEFGVLFASPGQADELRRGGFLIDGVARAAANDASANIEVLR